MWISGKWWIESFWDSAVICPTATGFESGG